MALEFNEWLFDRDNIWLQPNSLVLSALHISAYPRIHMWTDTVWSSQWQGREEMVLEGCQAGSSEWPYMVKSAVSRTERQKRQRQWRSIEIWNTQWPKYGKRPRISCTSSAFLWEVQLSKAATVVYVRQKRTNVSLCTDPGITNCKGWALDEWCIEGLNPNQTHLTSDRPLCTEAAFEALTCNMPSALGNRLLRLHVKTKDTDSSKWLSLIKMLMAKTG